MKNVLIGLVIGILAGGAGMWFYFASAVEAPLRDELASQNKMFGEKESDLQNLHKVHDDYMQACEKEKAGLLKQLAERDSELGKLKARNEKLLSNDKLAGELEGRIGELSGVIAKYKEAFPDFDPKGASDKEIQDEKAMRDIMDRMKRLTAIGGPLNDYAVKELGLDENSVADVNRALKDEGQRMHKRLAEWAAGFVEEKTHEELLKMSDLQISTTIMPYIAEELGMLRKMDPEDQRAMQFGEKHFVTFLPKDSKMTKIVKMLYEERMKTYETFPRYLSEEQEKVMKDKYIQSGTFVFPGGAGYGMGQLSPEDLEK